RSPLLRMRAQQELPQIESVKRQHASRVALVPVLASEPTGIDKLKQLAG
ncbi:TPA: arsenical pump-driving ATPase, partial [Escherichia coli]